MLTSLFIRNRVALPALCLAVLALSACAAPPKGGSSSAPAASISAPAETVALPYTTDYLLIDGGVALSGERIYGLADKDKNVILPAKYREISVSETGMIFASHQDGDNTVCQIFRADGSQVGPDYSGIEYAYADADGTQGTLAASSLERRPAPPYAASTGLRYGDMSCWILDENAQPKNPEPYTDLRLFVDGSIIACRGGARYVFNADGSEEVLESRVVKTYFGGKYQVKITYQNAWDDVFYALLDKDGNVVAPPEYSRIQVPFEDRYVLYKGWALVIDGAQAFLYDDTGKLLADDSNSFGFVTTPDSGYIGVSMVGNVFDGGTWSPESTRIFDDAGIPEPHGYYFVDRDGKRLGERYTCIDFFENEAAEKTGIHYTTRGSNILTDGGGAATPNVRNVALDTPVSDAYFRVIRQDGTQAEIPLSEMLIK